MIVPLNTIHVIQVLLALLYKRILVLLLSFSLSKWMHCDETSISRLKAVTNIQFRIIIMDGQKLLNNIMTCIPIASKRLDKHIPAVHTHMTIRQPLLGKGLVNTLP
jgi:hypothetical protein